MVGVDRPIKALSMHIQKPLRVTKGNNSHRISPYFFAISICHVNMNVCARLDSINDSSSYVENSCLCI